MKDSADLSHEDQNRINFIWLEATLSDMVLASSHSSTMEGEDVTACSCTGTVRFLRSYALQCRDLNFCSVTDALRMNGCLLFLGMFTGKSTMELYDIQPDRSVLHGNVRLPWNRLGLCNAWIVVWYVPRGEWVDWVMIGEYWAVTWGELKWVGEAMEGE